MRLLIRRSALCFRIRELTPSKRMKVENMWDAAPFMKLVGAELVAITGGIARSRLQVQRHHQQQNGVAHAGCMATMLDHTAGAAGWTLLKDDSEYLLSIEFKTNLLRPASGTFLHCAARVISTSDDIIHAESTLYHTNTRDFDPYNPESVRAAAAADPKLSKKLSSPSPATAADFVASCATVSLMVLRDVAMLAAMRAMHSRGGPSNGGGTNVGGNTSADDGGGGGRAREGDVGQPRGRRASSESNFFEGDVDAKIRAHGEGSQGVSRGGVGGVHDTRSGQRESAVGTRGVSGRAGGGEKDGGERWGEEPLGAPFFGSFGGARSRRSKADDDEIRSSAPSEGARPRVRGGLMTRKRRPA